MSTPGDRNATTRLLEEVKTLRGADTGVRNRLFAIVYDELRALARSVMSEERSGHTLTPTALVHEAFVRLIEQDGVSWECRAHFFGIASRAMREILVDHARGRAARKRGGGRTRITLEEALIAGKGPDVEILDLHAALERLAEIDERSAQVAEMHSFAGLTTKEIAEGRPA